MSRKGTKLEFLSEMHQDLLRNLRMVVMESDECNGINEICEKTIMKPAKRFYVSTLQAYKVVSKIRKGDFRCLERMPDYRKEMFFEISKMVDEYLIRYEYARKPLLFVIGHVISNKAPRFYISAESVRKLYYQHQREKRKCYRK